VVLDGSRVSSVRGERLQTLAMSRVTVIWPVVERVRTVGTVVARIAVPSGGSAALSQHPSHRLTKLVPISHGTTRSIETPASTALPHAGVIGIWDLVPTVNRVEHLPGGLWVLEEEPSPEAAFSPWTYSTFVLLADFRQSIPFFQCHGERAILGPPRCSGWRSSRVQTF
jgi:hypothetical protein